MRGDREVSGLPPRPPPPPSPLFQEHKRVRVRGEMLYSVVVVVYRIMSRQVVAGGGVYAGWYNYRHEIDGDVVVV